MQAKASRDYLVVGPALHPFVFVMARTQAHICDCYFIVGLDDVGHGIWKTKPGIIAERIE